MKKPPVARLRRRQGRAAYARDPIASIPYPLPIPPAAAGASSAAVRPCQSSLPPRQRATSKALMALAWAPQLRRRWVATAATSSSLRAWPKGGMPKGRGLGCGDGTEAAER